MTIILTMMIHKKEMVDPCSIASGEEFVRKTKRRKANIPSDTLSMRRACWMFTPSWGGDLVLECRVCTVLPCYTRSFRRTCFQGFDLRAMGEMLINQAQGEMERQEQQVCHVTYRWHCPIVSVACALSVLSSSVWRFFLFQFCCRSRVPRRRTHAVRVMCECEVLLCRPFHMVVVIVVVLQSWQGCRMCTGYWQEC